MTMRRVVGALITLCLLASGTAFAQTGTVMPSPKFTALADNGTPCASCKLYAYVAGTTTPQDTFNNVDLAPGHANLNPIILDAAGRATVFLSAASYKFVLTDSSGGTTYWTQDNISANASFTVATDIAGVAGEAITAGQVVYLSDGSGSKTAGSWYLADADFTYASSSALAVGIAPSAIASGGTGAIRLAGRVTGLTGLVAGTTYYVSATAGALTSVAPPNARTVGAADSTTSLVQSPLLSGFALLSGANVFTNTTGQTVQKLLLAGSTSGSVTLKSPAISGANTVTFPAGTTDFSATGGTGFVLKQDSAGAAITVGAPAVATADNGINDFRLTLTSGTPVTTQDVTAATTLYCTPGGKGNRIALFDSGGTATVYSSAEFSIAVPATTSQMYDVFAYSNAGVATLELLAWTNDTTRATAIVLTTTGSYTKSGDLTRRYLASFRTTTVSGQTEDSYTKRYVWNYYNRVNTALRRLESTASWTYTTATWRQANASTANQVEIVNGIAEDEFRGFVQVFVGNSVSGPNDSVAIGENSTTTPATGAIYSKAANVSGASGWTATGVLTTYPAIGYTKYVWLEIDNVGGGTTTWTGVSANIVQAGMTGDWRR